MATALVTRTEDASLDLTETVKSLQAQLRQIQNNMAATALTPSFFEPQNWAQAWELAKVIADSDFSPKDYRGKPGNVVVAMQYGKDLGIPIMQAIQNISVVNGRPSIWGSLYWALITNHRDFVDFEEEITNKGAKITLTRRGRKPVFREFTEAMAQKAGLLSKDSPWRTYPESMYMWRVRHAAGDALFPEATKGILPREVANDYTDGPTIDGSVVQSAQQATTTEPQIITQDQAREFGKAWKASGYSIEEAKAKLKEFFSVDSSLKIPADGFDKAMGWASKSKQVVSPDEKICREMFAILEYDLTRQAQAIADADGNWSALATKLNAELPEDK